MAKGTTSRAKISKPANSAGIFLRVLVYLAAILVIASAWAWWHYVRSNPERVFNGMIENSLRTTGISRVVQQSSGEQKLDQTVQLMTSPTHAAHATTNLSQTGDNAANVITETIGTPFEDFVQYKDIITTQKSASGKNLDFSDIKNLWGKTSTPTTEATQTNGELYNESVLGVVPFANLPYAQRNALLQQIQAQRVYTVDYSNVKRVIKNGRPVYVYNVSVAPAPYVAMLKQLGHDLGLTQLETVEPANYKNSSPLEFEVSVDVWTRQLTNIAYSNSDRVESFSGYGVQTPITLPTKTIPIDELQQRVQSIE